MALLVIDLAGGADLRVYPGADGWTSSGEQRRVSSRERRRAWAATIGPSAAAVVERILADKPHPEQGYRSCMALIRTAKAYGHERTEAACGRALAIGSPTRKSVEAILKRGLDRVPLADEKTPNIVVHENIRGGDYFDKEEQHDQRRDDEEVA